MIASQEEYNLFKNENICFPPPFLSSLSLFLRRIVFSILSLSLTFFSLSLYFLFSSHLNLRLGIHIVAYLTCFFLSSISPSPFPLLSNDEYLFVCARACVGWCPQLLQREGLWQPRIMISGSSISLCVVTIPLDFAHRRSRRSKGYGKEYR